MAEYSKERLHFLKLPADFFQSHRMRILEAMPNGGAHELLYLKLMAESVSHNGYLRYSEDIPYDARMIGAITGTSEEEAAEALKAFECLGLLEWTEDGSMFFPEVPKLTASSTIGAERKKSQRETKGGQGVDKRETNVHQSIEFR